MLEPLTAENENRYVMFPLKYNDMWNMYQDHRKAFWNESEIDMSRDRSDFEKLNNDEKRFIKYVLAFFAGSDGIVLENLVLRFSKEIQIPEARAFYSFQMAMETIHSIVYSQLIDEYIIDETEKEHLFKAIHTIPSVQKKALWAKKWIDSTDSFATRLVAMACVEGIFFSGSFCCIYWIKERGILPGLCQSNDLISRDEGLHTKFAHLLYTYVVNILTEEQVHTIIKEAVDIECEFITESVPCRLLGMNSDMMIEYIKFIANNFAVDLGYNILYPNVKQPFPFMERICFNIKSNFFEKETTQYQWRVENGDGNTNEDLDFNAYF